jgi:hypothetical protein
LYTSLPIDCFVSTTKFLHRHEICIQFYTLLPNGGYLDCNRYMPYVESDLSQFIVTDVDTLLSASTRRQLVKDK